MTVKTRAQLNTDADTNLAENEFGDISATDARQIVKDLADSAKLAEDIGDTVQAHSAVLDGTTASFTVAQETKLGFIAVTQAVDLDAIETRVNALDAAVVLVGAWDASVGTFPGGGTAQAGESYIVSVGGTVDGEVFSVNDRIIAILDNASTATYAANWIKADYTDQVLSVAGQTGAVTLDADDVAETAGKKWAGETGADVTDAGNVGAAINGAAEKSAIVDGDKVGGLDSEAANGLIWSSWTSIKAFLKTYFDTLYAGIATSGSITPIFTFTTPGDLDVTYTDQKGGWIRNGQLVTFWVELKFDLTHSTASGFARIGTLPDAAINSRRVGLAIGAMAQVTLNSSTQMVLARLTTAGNLIALTEVRTGIVDTQMDIAAFPSGTTNVQLVVSGSYEAAT